MSPAHGYRAVAQLDGTVVAERSCSSCHLQGCECLLDVFEAARRAAHSGEVYVETLGGARLTTRTPVRDPAAPMGRNLPPLSRAKGGRHAA